MKKNINKKNSLFKSIKIDNAIWWRKVNKDNVVIPDGEYKSYNFALYYLKKPKKNKVNTILTKYFMNEYDITEYYEQYPEKESQLDLYGQVTFCHYKTYKDRKDRDKISIKNNKGEMLVEYSYSSKNRNFGIKEIEPNSGLFEFTNNNEQEKDIINDVLQDKIENGACNPKYGGITNEDVTGYIFVNTAKEERKNIIMPHCNDGYWYNLFDNQFGNKTNKELIDDLNINEIKCKKDFFIIPVKLDSFGHYITLIVNLNDNSIHLFDSSKATMIYSLNSNGEWCCNNDSNEPQKDIFGNNLNIQPLNKSNIQGKSGTCGFYTAVFCVEASKCKDFDELKNLCENNEMQIKVAKQVSNIIDNMGKELNKIPKNTVCVNKEAQAFKNKDIFSNYISDRSTNLRINEKAPKSPIDKQVQKGNEITSEIENSINSEEKQSTTDEARNAVLKLFGDGLKNIKSIPDDKEMIKINDYPQTNINIKKKNGNSIY